MSPKNFYKRFRIAFPSFMIVSLLTACNLKNNNQNNLVDLGEWEIAETDAPASGAGADSREIILMNPARYNSDILTYNGLYSDEYVKNDSLNATLIYNERTGYSIHFNRMVVVVVNPEKLVATAKIPGHAPRHLTLTRNDSTEAIFSIHERDVMDTLLNTEKPLYVLASPTPEEILESSDRQTYSFSYDTRGYRLARFLLSEGGNHH